MSLKHAPDGATTILHPLLFVTFAATAVACSGVGPEGDDAQGPDVLDPSSLPGDEEGSPLRRGRTADDGEAPADPSDPSDPAAPAGGLVGAPGDDEVADDAPQSAGASAPVPDGWLYTQGNRILRAGGGRWQGDRKSVV